MTDAKPAPFDPPADALIAKIASEAEYWRVQAIYFRQRDEHQLAQDADTRRQMLQRARDRIAQQAERIAELERELKRQNEANDMLGEERDAAMRGLVEARQRIEGYQGSRDYAIDLLCKALAVAPDKMRSVEYYARLASEKLIEAQRGWICPACGRANAPANKECGCRGNKTLRERMRTP